ncbi:zygote arrest protein 1-like [Physella acuta]|uniref:zygote arrest protein 1-like n=1 Tax=Physella acuta TaxID=109671 RepID=UPI0027DC7FA2|nr:zygote arrest protein 1-like [Physella acuta]
MGNLLYGTTEPKAPTRNANVILRPSGYSSASSIKTNSTSSSIKTYSTPSSIKTNNSASSIKALNNSHSPRAATQTGRRRQTLERFYGFFRCPKCRKTWESTHVYCKPRTLTAVYGQECKECRVECRPYKVEKLICSVCHSVECVCLFKERHVDKTKHHRSDLCLKCKAGLPCV